MSKYVKSLTLQDKYVKTSPKYGNNNNKYKITNIRQDRMEIESSKSAPKYKPKKVVKNFSTIANNYKPNDNKQKNNTKQSMTESFTGSLFTFNKISKKSTKNKTKDSKLDISVEIQKTSNFSKMNDIQRQTTETLKNKKEYESRIMTIKNRINAIKKQEEDLNKKMNKIKKIEIEREIVKNDKIQLQRKINQVEKGKRNEIANKKIKAQDIRLNLSRNIEKSADRVFKRKNKDFQIKKQERQKLEGIQKQIKTEKIEQNKKMRVKRVEELERAKQEEEIFELLKEQEKINQLAYVHSLAQKDADNLKNYLEKLEKEEENCLKSLKTTQILTQKKLQESGMISPMRKSYNRNCKTPVNFHHGRTLSSVSDLSSSNNQRRRFRF